MRQPRIVVPLILAAALGAGATSHAAEEDALSDTARELFVKGVRAYEQQKWDQCRAALLAAFAIKRHSQIAGNLAECELKLGKHRDAAEHAWFWVHALRPDTPPERRTAAEGLLKETQKKVGTVAITVDLDGTSVLVDGQAAGKSPLDAPLFVEPGRHTIEALRSGDPGARTLVDVAAGETRDVALTLKKKEPPPPPSVVEMRPLWPALASGGAAVVAFAVGGALAAVASAKRSDGNALSAKLPPGAVCAGTPAASVATQCQAILNDGTTHDALDKGALGAFVAGGALALTAAGLAVWCATGPQTSTGPKTGVRVTPSLGHGQAGVTVLGTW